MTMNAVFILANHDRPRRPDRDRPSPRARRRDRQCAHVGVGDLFAHARRYPELPLSARRKTADRPAERALRREHRLGARGLVPARGRRPRPRRRPAGFPRQPAFASRSLGRDADPDRARVLGAAPLDRARRRRVAGFGRAGLGQSPGRTSYAARRRESPSRGLAGRAWPLPFRIGRGLRPAMAAALSRDPLRAERALSPARPHRHAPEPRHRRRAPAPVRGHDPARCRRRGGDPRRALFAHRKFDRRNLSRARRHAHARGQRQKSGING